MQSTQDLASHIQSKAINNEHFVIAISGFGGAGKSTTTERLSTLLGNATVIHTDDFIAADDNGALEGYHLDWEKLEEVIKTIKTSNEVTSRIYDWSSNRPVDEKTSVNKYIIIEGSLWLIQDKFKPYFDLTIWINVPQDTANSRGKKRDTEEYGVDHDELWDNVWGPREKDSFNKLQPDKHVDILLDNDASIA